jgi:predicted phage tail component-like protein
MSQNYDFLRTFTFDGNETNHLFQIAKVNIPFLSKDNEFYTVGNTDARHFRSTRLGDYTLSIDGFVIKDNTGMSVSDSLDELKVLLNSDEPKQLVFDVFPDRYFNAIFSGVQEYDATNLDYTPLTLVFDVPDGLAHSIEPIGFSNTNSTTTNLMLDSEYNATYKYMKPWVEKLDEKFNNSNVVQADFRTGIPLNFERDDKTDERWLNWNPATTIHNADLKVGDEVNFSVYAQVVSIDEENDKDYAGQVILEEWDTVKATILKRHIVYIPKKVTTEFTKYGSVVKIENEKTNAINLQYGFRGSNLIKWSKPMVSFLPPIGATVTAPSVGAKAYSNSLDFGNYDYSWNPNIAPNVGFNDFYNNGSQTGYTAKDGVDHIAVTKTADASPAGKLVNLRTLLPNKTYTLSVDVWADMEVPSGAISCGIQLKEGTTVRNVWVVIAKPVSTNRTTYSVTFTTAANFVTTEESRITFWFGKSAGACTGYLGYNIKIEEGSTATPYQPNLLDAPHYLSKVALGENIADPTKNFPYILSSYNIYQGRNTEKYQVNQTYTLTMKATKPATQQFGVYLLAGAMGVGNMQPVEGLTDVWKLTFKVTQAHIDGGVTDLLDIYQYPNTDLGAVKIEWLKLEKGDTRTPNIPYYKYEGIAPAPSNNPKDYHWGYSPSYINAVEYVPSGDSIDELIKIENNGTYKAYPQINFTMNGENGLVAVLNENGNVLQFGNPEDVDGTIATRLDMGLNEKFWGNNLPTNITINSGFNSVYPNMNSNPATPNLFDGGFDMTTYADAIRPTFPQVTKDVWHGPSMILPITAPTNNDRTGSFGVHTRFYFRNINKGERGRLEFAVNDETGANAMTFIVRDSSIANTEIVLEMWYKKKKLNQVSLDRKVFKKDFFEINMERTGKQLTWRFVQINSLNKYDNVIVDKQYKFTWNLEADDATKFTSTGVWFMRYGNTPHNPMYVTDTQVKWYNTPFFNNVKNIFQDGDNVTIDVEERAIYINGAINNDLNIVGNEWEQFRLGLGTTVIQPVVSSWAHPANVNVTFRQSYL